MNRQILRSLVLLLIASAIFYLGLKGLEIAKDFLWLENKKTLITAVDQCMSSASFDSTWNEDLFKKCMASKGY